MKEPLISIIIPVFNRAKFLPETLDSVANQTYQNWECLIVDDGSTDDSLNIAKAYSEKDTRFKIHQRNRQPKGAPVCRNIGIDQSKGDYIIFLDSDDLLMKYCLQKRVEATEPETSKEKQHPVLIFPMGIFDSQIMPVGKLYSNKTEEEEIYRFLRNDIPWTITCPFWPRKVILDLNGFDESFPNCQDVDLHLRFLELKYPYQLCYDVEPDCFYRQHQDDKIFAAGNFNKASVGIEMLIIKHLSSVRDDSTLNQKKIRNNFSTMGKNALMNLLRQSSYERVKELFGVFRKIGLFSTFTSIRMRLMFGLYKVGLMKVRGMERLWNIIFFDQKKKNEFHKHEYHLKVK